MVFKLFRGDAEEGIAQIENQLRQMLADDRHSFDLAVSALVGGADAAIVGPDLQDTDRRVNELEREIRRELVVHVSVQGAADLPSILAYMSVVKDVERIGDYAKNIFDLAALDIDLSNAEDLEVLHGHARRVSELIAEAADAFTQRDKNASQAIITEGDALQDEYDALVAAQVSSAQGASEAVPRALFYRHLKRIVAHLMNLLSAVVMPLDQLDYFDEDKATRG